MTNSDSDDINVHVSPFKQTHSITAKVLLHFFFPFLKKFTTQLATTSEH